MPGKKKKIRKLRGDGKEYVKWSNKPGDVSSHLLMDKGKEVYPSVFPKKKGSHDPKDWIDEPDSEKAYKEAKKRGEVVKFATKRRALKMAMGAWKEKQDNPFKGKQGKETRKAFRKEVRKRKENG
jgi:hypothetical protein